MGVLTLTLAPTGGDTLKLIQWPRRDNEAAALLIIYLCLLKRKIVNGRLMMHVH